MEKFWKEYINGDCFKRKEKIEQLMPVFKPYLDGAITDKKTREYTFKSLLQSYFDDLIDVMNTKKMMHSQKISLK